MISRRNHCSRLKNEKQALYEALRVRILTFDLAPGTRMDEALLAEACGVSRTPLREVFHRLAGEGSMTLESNRGAAVSSMSLSVMRNFFQTAPIDHTRMSQTFYLICSMEEQHRVDLACTQHDQMIEAIGQQQTAHCVELTLDHWALSRIRIRALCAT